jgi:hypothetical protein
MTFALLSEVYGLGWVDLNEMPIAAITAYMDRVPNMIALRKLIAGEGAVVPYAKDSERTLEKWLQEFSGETDKVIATPGMLMMIGIGVKHVPRTG